MLTYFVLTLWCVTCNPQQIYTIHGIPAFTGGSAVWADLNCQQYGDILSGDWDRRNIDILPPKRQAAAKDEWVFYSCTPETAFF